MSAGGRRRGRAGLVAAIAVATIVALGAIGGRTSGLPADDATGFVERLLALPLALAGMLAGASPDQLPPLPTPPPTAPFPTLPPDIPTPDPPTTTPTRTPGPGTPSVTPSATASPTPSDTPTMTPSPTPSRTTEPTSTGRPSDAATPTEPATPTDDEPTRSATVQATRPPLYLPRTLREAPPKPTAARSPSPSAAPSAAPTATPTHRARR